VGAAVDRKQLFRIIFPRQKKITIKIISLDEERKREKKKEWTRLASQEYKIICFPSYIPSSIDIFLLYNNDYPSITRRKRDSSATILKQFL